MRELKVACSLRKATLDDVPELEALIAESARGLCGADYTAAQIEAALGSAFGVDSILIRDGTYFAVEADGELVACGGWSHRKTLFGSDQRADREPELLVPGRDPARIRAFFVRPGWARQGIGRALLDRCEAEAQEEGFTALELMATLTGLRLYQTMGYREVEVVQWPLDAGGSIEFRRMRKELRWADASS